MILETKDKEANWLRPKERLYTDKPIPEEVFTRNWQPTSYATPPPQPVYSQSLYTAGRYVPYTVTISENRPKESPSGGVNRIFYLLLFGIIAFAFFDHVLNNHSKTESQPAPITRSPLQEPVQVRRGLLIKLPATLTMPDHTIVRVNYLGQVSSPEALPPGPNRIGDAFLVGKYLWVWTTDSTHSVPTWIDP